MLYCVSLFDHEFRFSFLREGTFILFVHSGCGKEFRRLLRQFILLFLIFLEALLLGCFPFFDLYSCFIENFLSSFHLASFLYSLVQCSSKLWLSPAIVPGFHTGFSFSSFLCLDEDDGGDLLPILLLEPSSLVATACLSVKATKQSQRDSVDFFHERERNGSETKKEVGRNEENPGDTAWRKPSATTFFAKHGGTGRLRPRSHT